MITDSYFQQGASHEVCEDYALHGNNYVIVCDGCSNGGGPSIESDWGARILAKSAEHHIDELNRSTDVFLLYTGTTMLSRLEFIPNLSPDCITATLLVAKIVGEFIVLVMVGDGAYGVRNKNGDWEIHNYEFQEGGSTGRAAPYYLRYGIRGEANRYFELHGGKFLHTIYSGKLDGEMKTEIISGVMNPDKPYFCESYPLTDFDFAFVASDGVSSFYEMVKTETSKFTSPVETIDALRVLLDDINYRTAGFARRQRQWAFKRDVAGTFVRKNWHNADDVSFGGIYRP